MKYLGTMIVALALAAPAAAQTGPATDLFAFSQGARLVQVPDDAEFTAMDSSPLNLIDGSATTDWTGEAGRPARTRRTIPTIVVATRRPIPAQRTPLPASSPTMSRTSPSVVNPRANWRPTMRRSPSR